MSSLTVNDFKVGFKIGFRYNRRFVCGVIETVYDNHFVIKLAVDYIGKNEEWFAGESKVFSKKAMKKLSHQGKNQVS